MSARSLTIVTAADDRYWRCVDQFLRSARRHKLHQGRYSFVVYDLGLSPRHRATLQKRWPWCEWRSFDFAAHPPHFALEHRNYAWKPWVIADAAKHARMVLWLDSATLFQSSDLDSVTAAMASAGSYTLRGKKTLEEGCDAGVLQHMRCAPELLKHRIRVSGVVGFNLDHAGARMVLRQWAEATAVAQNNLPPSPFHSADQSLLSIVLHQSGMRLNEDDIDISSGWPVRWMSSRNKVSPHCPRLLEPAVRAYYRGYKAIDQAGWRAKRLHAETIKGLSRYPKEHFSVRLSDGQREATVRAPLTSYYADPFLWGRWLFLEEFRYTLCRGRIIALAVGSDLSLGEPRAVLELPTHCSFPHVFSYQGQLLMLPETSAQRTIDLYACSLIPFRWELKKRLINGIDAADSVLFPHNDRWWIITSVLAPGASQRHLAIFYASDPLSSDWVAHPVNSEKRYGNARFGYGRNAGRMRTDHSLLLRRMHASTRYYGEAMQTMHVTVLTPERFEEQAHTQSTGAHHEDADSGLLVWDTRDRVA